MRRSRAYPPCYPARKGEETTMLIDSGSLAPMDPTLWRCCAVGLGVAFALTLCLLLAFMLWSRIDHGFLGLILLLTLIVFAVTFSFLIAAGTPGIGIKIVIALIDGLLAVAAKLLSGPFLNYLKSD